MLAHTHLALGTAAGLAMVSLTDTAPPTSIELAALLLGSLAPDVDSNTSIIGRPGQLFERFLPKPARQTLDFVGRTVTGTINKVFGHRGFFHWPALAFVLIFFGLWFDRTWLCWFGLGYASHIFGDFFTAQGAPLFAPLYWKCIGGGPIRTGSWVETGLSVVLWGYVCWQGFYFLPDETRNWLERYAKIVHIDQAPSAVRALID